MDGFRNSMVPASQAWATRSLFDPVSGGARSQPHYLILNSSRISSPSSSTVVLIRSGVNSHQPIRVGEKQRTGRKINTLPTRKKQVISQVQ